MFELGRVDVCLESSTMAGCVALPREGHLEMLCRTFSHLKKYHNVQMAFDPHKPSINDNDFERNDLSRSEFSFAIKKE